MLKKGAHSSGAMLQCQLFHASLTAADFTLTAVCTNCYVGMGVCLLHLHNGAGSSHANGMCSFSILVAWPAEEVGCSCKPGKAGPHCQQGNS